MAGRRPKPCGRDGHPARARAASNGDAVAASVTAADAEPERKPLRDIRTAAMMESASSSSSASGLEDLFRLIPPFERAAFGDMLDHEMRGRELPPEEMRRVAERCWQRFLKDGWPR